MGISLSYRTFGRVEKKKHSAIIKLAAKKNRQHTWWCEELCLRDDLDKKGRVFGSTKLICNISDVDVDNYMAWLDAQEIVRFFCEASMATETDWVFLMVGAEFGRVASGKMDAKLEEAIRRFAEMFGENFKKFENKSRESVLAEWSDR